jgi:hypothetical protein
VTTCGNTNPVCLAVYERVHPSCPYCGFKPEPGSRSAPAFVDGDLCELDAATLAAMRGEVERVDEPFQAPRGQPMIGQMAGAKRHRQTQEAQAALREAIAWWAGHQRAAGRTDSESYRRFYFAFGIDVLGAQALGAKEAAELTDRINLYLRREFNVETYQAAPLAAGL